MLWCGGAVLFCAVLCCAVLCCVVLCCVLCCCGCLLCVVGCTDCSFIGSLIRFVFFAVCCVFRWAKRHPFQVQYQVGAMKSGLIKALQMKFFM